MDALHTLSAVALKDLLDRGVVSSVEIVDAFHRRADHVEPRVRAFVQQCRERAREEAAACDAARSAGRSLGPLHGLPLSIKESIDLEGVASTVGMRARLDAVAPRDAAIVRAARAAGAIVLGKTNVPQTLLSPMETVNALFGTTYNPWSHAHAPGGSSGGEAAALASGTSVLGIGTDIGGSLRTPASFCGVCGLKPTYGRWSNLGAWPPIAGFEAIRAQTGPMARTVGDLALLMSALSGPGSSAFDDSIAPLPWPSPEEVDLRTLRVGYYEDDGFFTPAASVRRAVREARDALLDAGVEVVPFTPPHAAELVFLYFQLITSDGAATLREALRGEPVIDPLRTLWRMLHLPEPMRRATAQGLRIAGETRLATLLESAGRQSVEQLFALTTARDLLRDAERRAWEHAGLSALLAPVFVTPAVPHGMSHDFTVAFSYVARYNLLNLPAGVVPVTRVRSDETARRETEDRLDQRAAQVEARSAGLPVGVQVIGRPWREHEVLAVMAAIERALVDARDRPRTPVDP